jgi:hypothetical protein
LRRGERERERKKKIRKKDLFLSLSRHLKVSRCMREKDRLMGLWEMGDYQTVPAYW